MEVKRDPEFNIVNFKENETLEITFYKKLLKFVVKCDTCITHTIGPFWTKFFPTEQKR